MKQKYTLTISDMEINVITDEPQESVEHIVGILDRRIREITLKSKRCSRNEAALLCALDFCAEKIAVKERADELENHLRSKEEEIAALNERLALLSKNADRLEKENARLQTDNAKLRAVLDDMRDRGLPFQKPTSSAQATEEAEIDGQAVLSENKFSENSLVDNGNSEDALEDDSVKVVESVEDDSQKKKNSRNRVGSMFDLLTFSDI